MRRIRLDLKSRGYDIAISGNFGPLSTLVEKLRLGRNACCVTNKKLRLLFGHNLKDALERIGVKLNFIEIPDGERSKSIFQSLKAIDKLLYFDRSERPFIIAAGGGVVGDLAGYVASIYKRGIPYIQVPTTLLSQVDSAIGGKVGVDLPSAKNLIGSFYQPKLVYINTDTLRSLPARQIRNGLAEVIKYGVIKDRALFEMLERDCKKAAEKDDGVLSKIIYRSARIKARLVELDERDEKGIRIILNFGHTIGHAIEQATGYSGRIYHGEAISLGMIIAADISVKLKMLDKDTALRIRGLIAAAGLPVMLKGVSVPAIAKAYSFDKKFIRGANRLVLPIEIGRAVVREAVPDSTIISAIEKNIQV